MNKQTLLSSLLAMFVIMTSIEVYAYDIAVENEDGITIYYNFYNEDQELEVAQNPENKYTGNIRIPEAVTYGTITRNVTSIGDRAFLECSDLVSVTIPSSLTSIGEYAFSGCSGLTAVHITDLAAWCRITFLSSFADANRSNPLTYARHLFLNGTEIKDLVIPNGVTSINRNAFNNCSDFKSVTIPNSVTIIDDYAFYNCDGLKSLTIPNSVKTIGNATFAWCDNLATVAIPNSVTSLGESVFAQCQSLNSITIPNSITSISKHSFYWCVNLNSVTIPSDVTYIGESAFEGCDHLASLTLPSRLTGIDKSAFSGCKNLSSIAIPESVCSIGRYAFYQCDNLMSVTSMITDPFVINPNVFGQNTKDNGTLFVPYGTIEKYKATEGWNSFVSIIEHKGTCETPTISYDNGKLTFNCATEGATCISSISDTDVATYNTNEVQLNVTYIISVYATKEGYNNSETATATLCWIEQEPKAEGDIDEVVEVKASPLLIQYRENKIVITGVDDGTDIRVYNVSGSLIGSAQSRGRQAVVDAVFPTDSVAIVKVGNNAVKVIIR